MKNSKPFLVLLVLVLATAILVSGAPAPAQAATTYIQSVAAYAFAAREYNNAKLGGIINALADLGYPHAIDCDFNYACYSDASGTAAHYAPLVMGYTTTENPEEAITGFIATDNDGGGESPRTFDGIEYYVMGGWADAGSPSWEDALDMNRFTEGADIFLYYTYDPRAGAPITAINCKINQEHTDGWITVLDSNGNSADFNHAAQGGKDTWVYMVYQRGDANLTGSALSTGSLIAIIGGAAVLATAAVLVLTRKKPAQQ